MSSTISPPNFPGLVDSRGAERRFDAHITGCCTSRDNSLLAFSTGEGDVILAPRSGLKTPDSWTVSQVHDGPALTIAPDVSSDAFLTGGEDCHLKRTSSSGTVETVARSRRWIEHVTTFSQGKTALIAFASGKEAQLWAGGGSEALRTFEHASTVSGLAFDGKGKRLAASHYNGLSLWFVQSKDGKPRLLEWKGSHLGVAIHPAGEAVVTAMQENELHGWRLSDGHNMRMSGYPSKIGSMAFTRNGKWLATSGADCVVMWPFFGGGPIGKPPMETPGIPGVNCTRVATHPTQDIVAAGFADGAVLMVDYTSHRVLPVCAAAGGPVSALAFSSDGCILGYGTEDGRIGALDLTAPD
ncbi:WD40 repeat domain-containing protein [Acetobacter sp. DsW_063]|uniref:WD40 repeat domain-containing protein n=1 Tax=Acetobacter sp. DsW_063 TaxID=1514894 RepID=UPI000A3AE483|nr:hypothetical protein [Acetobacter sp. DsW_063]OUJ14669.1 hypothetical protein HK28_12120 [Acetobacter sp. DsW_063]